jgi:hypothetical protein
MRHRAAVVGLVLLGLLPVSVPVRMAAQVSMPHMNLGGSSLMDGLSAPGSVLEPIMLEHYSASRFRDGAGRRLPGSNTIDTWASLVHLGHFTRHRILGGFYGVSVVLPLARVNLNTSFGLRGSQSGVGDLMLSPLLLAWPGHSLLHRRYFSRFALLARVPTGRYRPTEPVNVGSHEFGITVYYAFTLFLQPRWETSWRLHYVWNAANSAPFVGLGAATDQAGQAVHANFATSYRLSPSLRAGLSGYAFQQVSDHRLDGVALPGSRERVFALGPAFLLSAGSWDFTGNVDVEAGARNRPEGYRINLSVRRIYASRRLPD